MNDEALSRFRKAARKHGFQYDQELGSVNPSWTMSHDPHTGVITISYRPELLGDPRQIDRVGEIVQMRIHQLRYNWSGAG